MARLSIARDALRPIRSVLYTAGSSGKHLVKARTSGADATLLDLEDGVAPSDAAKVQARGAVVQLVSEGGFGGRLVAVRVNSLQSPWGREDLAAVAALRNVHAIALPKVESAGEVQEVASFLDDRGVPATTRLWPMIETPRGVYNVEAIAASHPRVSCITMGTTDLANSLNCTTTDKSRTPLLYSLSKCIVAARMNGLQILDGVHLDLEDTAGFEAACRQGKEMGMDGKTLIHPSTVAVANWFFGPSAEEVELSYRIISAMDEAFSRGQGACLVDGKLIETLHADNARKVIAVHEIIQAFEDQAHQHSNNETRTTSGIYNRRN